MRSPPPSCMSRAVPRLAEAQAAFRDAIVAGDLAAVLPMLTAGDDGRDPRHRLSIHQRHYDASLVDLLRKRFPALEWLVGEAYLAAAARAYALTNPPRRPALGAYGADFPAFLAARPGVEAMPWLAGVGLLEWQLAEVAAAVSQPAVPIDALAAFGDASLDTLRVGLQSGLAYGAFDWPVDDLVRVFLDGNPPPTLHFVAEPVRLEIRGGRGAFTVRRIDEAIFAFRRALASGVALAAAIAAGETAGEGAAGFDAGTAVAGLFTDGLVADIFAGETAE